MDGEQAMIAEKNYWRSKKILITQGALKNFAGSEIVTLELAEFFQNVGAKVVVFTWVFEEPIKTEFEKKKIYVTTAENDSRLQNFDYVWVHHQVLPTRLINLLEKNPAKLPYFFFYHMSALNENCMEHPYIYGLEAKLASNSLFVSEEALTFGRENFDGALVEPVIFPNFIPKKYQQKTTDADMMRPGRVLIVSNHIPAELAEAMKILRSMAITVEHIGRGGDSNRITTPTLLKKYDAVVTIGKTVQYCLGLGIPVYIYDRYGGCGYLGSNNYEKALRYNFSGRGFSGKGAQKITDEIIDKWRAAKKFQIQNYDDLTKKFNLENNLTALLGQANDPKPDSINWGYVRLATSIARQKTLLVGKNEQSRDALKIKEQELATLRLENANLASTITKMQNSRIVKAANLVHALPRKIKNRLRPTRPPEVLLIMCVYNETLNMQFFLDYVEKFVDGIVVIDDNSSDNTVKILKKYKKVMSIISTDNLHKDRSYDERMMRERVIREAKRVAKTSSPFVLCLDPDERPELKFLQDLHKIASKYNGQHKVLNMRLRELWGDIHHWRCDGIWQKKVRTAMFQLQDNMTFSFGHQYHAPWAYDEIAKNPELIPYDDYHLKMVKEVDREARKNRYNALDPKREIQKIGYDYLNDKTGLKLSAIEDGHEYDYNSVPNYYKDI